MIINNGYNKKSSLDESVETDASVDLQEKHLTCTALHFQNHTLVLNAPFSYSTTFCTDRCKQRMTDVCA